ncbi:MAG: M3 family metallopeptidase [Enterobacterales bacterium]|nr:M3 family metallopeptidase [Enterobacterales bacterium]
MTITNPLLLKNPIVQVDQIKPEQVVPAILQIIQQNQTEIDHLLDSTSDHSSLDWQKLIRPLERLDDRLTKAWSPVSHLNSVCNSDELREAYDKSLAFLTDYSTKMGQNQRLFELTEALSQKADELALSPSQRHILKHQLLQFKLSGLDLDPDKQAIYSDIQKQLAELSSMYQQNVMDSTLAWDKLIEQASDLAGLPETELAMLAEQAKQKQKQGYLINLEIPSYLAIMTYADDADLRQEVYTAYATRASSEFVDKQFDNAPVMEKILSLKYQKAQLLGFNCYADLSLQTKMAESPQAVIDFLLDLNQSARQQAKKEIKELTDFAVSLGAKTLQAWDVAYYSEKLKQQKYQISQAELRQYFVLEKVLQGLYDLTQRLYGVKFKIIENSSRWHKDVRHYQVLKNQQLVAEFYLDLFARAHKRGGAWMDSYQSRFKINDSETQIPIAYLTCNFAPPVNQQAALLTHDEVVTLFHEFGHGLHHMLTQVDELSASGIANVPWDAVELPSQFMENFCYHPEVIEAISGHVKTDENLPQDLLDKLIAAKNFQSGMAMLRQLEFALFDMRIHHSPPLKTAEIQQQLDQTRQQVAVMIPPKFNRFQNAFSHIFAGGYAAGYYSYKWAEVLSADVFAYFEEQGIFDSNAGVEFLDKILSKGGSADPMDLFVNFRGRKPQVDALLRHSGIG